MRGKTWPAQDIESVLVVIRRAIHNEIAGQRFYNDASFYCIDPWAKEIFALLAQEEEVHTRLLLLEYDALTTKGRWLDLETAQASKADIDITRLNFPEDEPTEELFPSQWSVLEAVDRRADDLAALAFGLEMEKAAIDLYSQAATASKEPAAQKAYGYLIEEEARHFQQLKARWEDLAGIPFDAS